jgi:hypothetical protein
MIGQPPHIQLLAAILATLEAVDWEAETGVVGLTIRHARHRFSTSSEKPCLSIRWTGNNDDGARGESLTAWEKPREMNVDLQIDMALPAESSDEDPTGWLAHSRIAAAALTALQTPGPTNALYPPLAQWVRGGDDAPDEDSKPDDARLVKSLSVLYRVKTEDESVLLGEGVNG